MLKEKSVESRKENDMLVEKIQRLTSKMSTEVQHDRYMDRDHRDRWRN